MKILPVIAEFFHAENEIDGSQAEADGQRGQT
jgi:hypothetical protein